MSLISAIGSWLRYQLRRLFRASMKRYLLLHLAVFLSLAIYVWMNMIEVSAIPLSLLLTIMMWSGMYTLLKWGLNEMAFVHWLRYNWRFSATVLIVFALLMHHAFSLAFRATGVGLGLP